MLKNYLLIAVRNLMRNRIYSLINIVGFALGLFVFLVIALIVVEDLAFDRFHEHPEDVYRLLTMNRSVRAVNAITSGALTKEAMVSIPEVVATTRVFNFGQINLANFGADESEQGIQRYVLGADSNFFKVFTAFKILQGDPDNQLKEPNTAVITQDVARAFYGDENPIGKTVTGRNDGPTVTITGIVSDCPPTSHLHYDVIVPALVTPQNAVWWESWDNIAGCGYLRAQPGTSKEVLERKLLEIGELHGLNEQYIPVLQPLLDVHLGSGNLGFDVNNWGKSDLTQVKILSIIALLALLIASINFINLSSARAIKRAREVGMRKVVGAKRSQLMVQFLGESVLLTLIATVVAAISVELALPHLSGFIGRQASFSLIRNPELLLALLGVAVAVGLAAGIYPALVLAGFQPMNVIKGSFRSSRAGISLRQILVVVQFAISIALIASVIIVLQQLKYVTGMDVGYSVDQVAVTFAFNQNVITSKDAFMDELRKIPSIEAVGSSNNLPAFGSFGQYEARAEDSPSDERDLGVNFMSADADFIPALGIKFAAGRNFEKGSPNEDQVIVNEATIRAAGWDDPIGRKIIVQDVNADLVPKTVIGVVHDFQFFSARQRIDPLMIEYHPENCGLIAFRIQGGKIRDTIPLVRDLWQKMFADIPFNSLFLDERFERQYQGDRVFAGKVGVFSTLAIIIASLGLLGLTSYATEQRRREIAVRKVLGSGEGRIVFLLTKDFVRWVLLANLVGWPLAWYAMHRWLSEFAFRMNMTLFPFITAGLAALVIAILTVSVQAYRAALTDPAEVLRTE